jgi:polyisoprenoid-binding protein YceI
MADMLPPRCRTSLVRMGERSAYNRGMKLPNLLAGLFLMVLLASCQTPAPQTGNVTAALPDLLAEYRELAKSGPVYAVNAAASTVRIYVYRAGAAARLGHNHVLSAPRFEGYVSLPTEQAADARFELRVPLADLTVDPAARNDTGGNFAGERSAADIEGTKANMLGARGFQADQFPLVRLRATSIEGDWPMLIAQVEVTLHGVTRTQPVLLKVERSEKQLKASGTLLLKQSDYGVTPFSALGGLMKVQDTVAIAFELSATRMGT